MWLNDLARIVLNSTVVIKSEIDWRFVNLISHHQRDVWEVSLGLLKEVQDLSGGRQPGIAELILQQPVGSLWIRINYRAGRPDQHVLFFRGRHVVAHKEESKYQRKGESKCEHQMLRDHLGFCLSILIMFLGDPRKVEHYVDHQ